VIGGTFGLLIAFWLSDMIVAFAPQQMAQIASVHIDSRVLLFTGCVSLLSGLLFGLMPALQASHHDLQSTLKEQRSTENPGRNSFRNFLVIGEMSIALVLLIGAGLLLRSFYRLQAVDPGFQPKNLLTMNFTLPIDPPARCPSDCGRSLSWNRALAWLRTIDEELALRDLSYGRIHADLRFGASQCGRAHGRISSGPSRHACRSNDRPTLRMSRNDSGFC